MSGLGEYGRARLEFLKACRPDAYERMVREGTLDTHLRDIDEYCHSEELRAGQEKLAQMRRNEPELEERDWMTFIGRAGNACYTRKQELMREVVMAGAQ